MEQFDLEQVDLPGVVKAILDLAIAFGVEITEEQYNAVVALAEAVAVRDEDV